MFIIIVNLVIILFAVNHVTVGNRPANRFVYSNVTGGYWIMD